MNSDSLNMVSRLGEGHMPWSFFLSEPQLKTTVTVTLHIFKKFQYLSLFVLICLQRVTVQFMFFLSKIQNPDQLTRRFKNLGNFEIEQGFQKKLVPSLVIHPSNSQCPFFLRDLTQKSPKFFNTPPCLLTS